MSVVSTDPWLQITIGWEFNDVFAALSNTQPHHGNKDSMFVLVKSYNFKVYIRFVAFDNIMYIYREATIIILNN